ncbi:MAG: 5-oxoprolinase subunit B family protein [Fimbriimonas sp.]
MRVEALGENAYILRDLRRTPAETASWIAQSAPVGLREAVPAFDSMGVYFEDGFDIDSLSEPADAVAVGGRDHTIPVCYELGEDLESVAAELGLTAPEVVALHSEPTYEVVCLGFCPGFAYLLGLPTPLDRVLRRPRPRPRVEPGSVAIAAGQAAVYPLPTPGGWALLGRTPLVLVDEEAGYFPIEAGDRVRFVPIQRDDFDARQGERL